MEAAVFERKAETGTKLDIKKGFKQISSKSSHHVARELFNGSHGCSGLFDCWSGRVRPQQSLRVTWECGGLSRARRTARFCRGRIWRRGRKANPLCRAVPRAPAPPSAGAGWPQLAQAPAPPCLPAFSSCGAHLQVKCS